MAIKLYQLESCPYCRRVRGVLEAKRLEYDKIEVPPYREERKELFEVSGQYKVPVLVWSSVTQRVYTERQNKADQGAMKARSEAYFVVRRNDEPRSNAGMQSYDVLYNCLSQ